MNSKFSYWKNGVKDGFPIFLGYMAVSFSFGIVAKSSGLTMLQAVLMSAANLTSAGQFASLGLIGASATYIEMAVTQLVINLRYCLMSCSLSQKLDTKDGFLHRYLIAYGVTDEIFGVSVSTNGKLSPFYSYGLISIAAPGWTLGTLLGVISGSLLPHRIISALSIALFGMFIAIIIPPAKNNKLLLAIILFSMLMSFLFTVIPILELVSPGFRIIILTILIAGTAAAFFPVQEKEASDER